eukprot:4318791-Pyramimonas_sp.AAC.1
MSSGLIAPTPFAFILGSTASRSSRATRGKGAARASPRQRCVRSKMSWGLSTGSFHGSLHSVARPCSIAWLSEVTAPQVPPLSRYGERRGSRAAMDGHWLLGPHVLDPFHKGGPGGQ